MLLICLMPAFVSNGNINWLEKVAFTAAHFGDLAAKSDLMGLISYMVTASLSQLSAWNWIINSFFLWCFGYIIEKKLKGWRYAAFILCCIVIGWVLVVVNAGLNVNKMYIGPSMMFFGMLGGYFAFFPRKHFEAQQWVRPSTEIFKREKARPVAERYWVNPWAYVIAFVIYEVLLQMGLNFGKEWVVNKTHIQFLGEVHQFIVGRIQGAPSAFNPISAVLAIGAGFVVAQTLPKLAMSMKPKRPGGKLQLEVIQHYRELRTLDMTHDQACEGAAKFAAVPLDLAKDWIAKGAAGLRDQEIQ